MKTILVAMKMVMMTVAVTMIVLTMTIMIVIVIVMSMKVARMMSAMTIIVVGSHLQQLDYRHYNIYQNIEKVLFIKKVTL